MSNAINPEHYNRLNPQPKDVIRAWGLNFNLGLKFQLRECCKVHLQSRA